MVRKVGFRILSLNVYAQMAPSMYYEKHEIMTVSERWWCWANV